MTMYVHQDQLEKLPLPPLRDTGDKLLEWSRVFLGDDLFDETRHAVGRFIDDPALGPACQEVLARLDRDERHPSWLEPLWKAAYLGNPEPLPIGSNVTFIARKNPATETLDLPEFVASLIQGLASFHQMIRSESLEPDFQGKAPLCMDQYKTLFAATRIPGEREDSYTVNPEARHAVLIHRGHYYSLEVLDKEGLPSSPASVAAAVRAILKTGEKTDPPAIGSLTTLPRRQWAGLRGALLKSSPLNRQNLATIEGALWVIVLDHRSYPDGDTLFKHLLGGDAMNRWYDKSLQFILGHRRDYAINYEHSGVDGTTLGRLVAHLYDHLSAPETTPFPLEDPLVRPMAFELDEDLKQAVHEASLKSEAALSDLSVTLLAFEDFGKDHIKKIGVSPDAFLQLSLQLAQFRLFGRVHNVYEAVMTKTFRGGRTETMRPVTPESLAFVKTPDLEHLKAAAEKHISRIRECQKGLGVDRHLFGLRAAFNTLHPQETEPEIFRSPGYLALTRSSFSTSTSSARGMCYAGYGPLLDDGYAARYLIFEDRLHFALTSKKSNEKNLQAFKSQLIDALRRMGNL